MKNADNSSEKLSPEYSYLVNSAKDSYNSEFLSFFGKQKKTFQPDLSHTAENTIF